MDKGPFEVNLCPGCSYHSSRDDRKDSSHPGQLQRREKGHRTSHKSIYGSDKLLLARFEALVRFSVAVVCTEPSAITHVPQSEYGMRLWVHTTLT